MSKPSLALIPTAYKAGKLYSVLPVGGAGDFTVTRNGTGTFIGKDGLIKTALANEPRFEYNPNGTFKGVLVEPSSTNLITDSTTFDNFSRRDVELINVGSLDSPFGDAFKLIPSSAVGNKLLIGNAGNQSIGTTVTLSVFCKKGELNGIRFYLNDTSQRFIAFNFDTEILDGLVENKGFQKLNNGWYRIFFTCTLNGNSNSFLISAFNNNPTVSYVGNNVDGIFISNPQYEINDGVTSYIPTINSQVTRPDDVITRNNAQDLIGQTEGSVYCEFNRPIFGFQPTVFRLTGNDSGLNEILVRFLSADSLQSLLRINGIVISSITSSLNVSLYKVLVIYTPNSFRMFLNGVLISNQTISNINFNKSIIRLGHNISSAQFSGAIKSFALFKTALTDQQAITLTTL